MSQYTRFATSGLKSAVIGIAIVSLMATPALATSATVTPSTAMMNIGDLLLSQTLETFFGNIQQLVTTVGKAVLGVYIAFQLLYVGVSSQTTQSLIKIMTAAVAFILLQSFDSVRTFLENSTDEESIVAPPPGEYATTLATAITDSAESAVTVLVTIIESAL